jgi:hypothetical protein
MYQVQNSQIVQKTDTVDIIFRIVSVSFRKHLLHNNMLVTILFFSCLHLQLQ